MRRQHFFSLSSVLCLALLAAAPAQFPYEAVIAKRVQVRSGPSELHYRTAILDVGERVTVLSEAPSGWLGIEPPADSFDWISGQYLREIAPGEGEVTGDRVNVRIGTPINEGLRDASPVQLSRGDRVRIIERKTFGQPPLAQLWYKVVPPKGDVRWAKADFLRRAGDRDPLERASAAGPAARVGLPRGERGAAERPGEEAGAEEVEPPDGADETDEPQPGAAPQGALEKAEAAFAAAMRKQLFDRDFAAARALYQQAARSATGAEQALIRRRLLDIQAEDAKKAKFSELDRLIQESKRRDSVLLSMSRPKATPDQGQPALYDGSGVLRKSAMTIDGKPAYVLVDPQGGVRYYLTAGPAIDLAEYLGKVVAVRGPVHFRSELRGQHIFVRDVTPIDMSREPRPAAGTREAQGDAAGAPRQAPPPEPEEPDDE